MGKVISRHNIRTEKEMIVYLTECTLATVSYLTTIKNKSKHEYERQISIAQCGIDWCKGFENLSSRVEDVVNKFNGDVKSWAESE